MLCRRCASETTKVMSEIAIHFPMDLAGPPDPHPLVFPQLFICLQCGFGDFKLSARDLRLIIEAVAKRSRDKSFGSRGDDTTN
jgi:hypothetical protein